MTTATDRIYRVNLKRLALLALPTWLRRPLAGALIYAGVAPLGRQLQQLRAFRQQTGQRLAYSGQVCRLRAVLNDTLDPQLRRIAIVEDDWSPQRQWSRLYRREQGRWLMVGKRASGPALINRRHSDSSVGSDFQIEVPRELQPCENRLRAIVNMYKLAGKRFEITYKQQ